MKGSDILTILGCYTTPAGQQICLRFIQSTDAGLLVDLFHHLSAETKRLRFHLYTERLPEERVWQEAITLSNLDPQRHVAVVATVVEADGEEHAVGVARFARALPKDREAEVAIVVRDDFQRKGVGRALLTQLAKVARERGITHFSGWVLAENVNLMKLIKNLEVTVETETKYGERKVRAAI
ncbi:MAG: GNAT family N-acetyltransferase [Anaerolineae bacterium]|nr:GNAT family N-acetyltransferase [Anaerolineae bacterium]